jgi:phenylalanyl-tRNA synthetase beta chain
MKFSFEWLNNYVNVDLPLDTVSERLTLAGLEVVGSEVIGCGWDNIFVGEIIGVEAHPNADRLRLVTVNIGNRQKAVVCGAPNVAMGQKIAFADVGAKLIDYHTGKLVKLEPATIRGVVSEGMICSERELGVADSHEGVMILSQEAPIGTSLVELLGDTVFDLDITPNRPDCLSIIGVAREIAALAGGKLKIPEIIYKESGDDICSLVSIEITEPEQCPRYCASLVTGIQVKESPQWMQQRLLKCGVRPINNIVDVTNYVMLEYGQPLHAFDYSKIYHRKIIVRRAMKEELIISLDGIERSLNSEILVIADAKKAIAVAGIMGGLETEVTANTSDVLIESANFNQAIIHKGSIDLKLSSEASLRFEKGLSRELPLIALKRATALMAEVTGGTINRGIVDVYPGQEQKKSILLVTSEIKRLLGMDVVPDEVVRSLKSLGFECKEIEDCSRFNVTVPWWRTDVNCSADLVEEVARIIGYDKIPTTMLSASIPEQEPNPLLDLRRKLRIVLVSCGFQEIITYSLTNREMLSKISPLMDISDVSMVRVANPMSKDYEYLRTSLRAGVLSVLNSNQRHQEGHISIFEVGKVFLPREGQLPEEKEMLCGVLSGMKHGLYWKNKSDTIDFFTAKGVVEAILSSLKLDAGFRISDDEIMYPGRVADIYIGEEKVGVVGELNQMVCQNFDLIDTAFLFEINLDKFLFQTGIPIKYQRASRYPSITRDIALVVDEQTTYQQIHSIIRDCPLVYQAKPIDLYIGEQVTYGKKSLAVRIVYQSKEHTLREQEIDKLQQQVLDKLRSDLGATLRA